MPESIFGEGRYVSSQEKDAYERVHGVKPVGYRATGPVEWFLPTHPDTAPCCKCGVATDRWAIGLTFIGSVPWGGATYNGHVLLAKAVWPFCQRCEDRNTIAVLRKRQGNMEILPELRARELASLQRLEAEMLAEAA